MAIFSIYAKFERGVAVEQKLRNEHRGYVYGFMDKIRYGGLKLDDEGYPVGIAFYIELESVESAMDFIKHDPYAPLYAEVDIKQFDQKIPVS